MILQLVHHMNHFLCNSKVAVRPESTRVKHCSKDHDDPPAGPSHEPLSLQQ